jgi:uncharacterized protein YukE
MAQFALYAIPAAIAAAWLGLLVILTRQVLRARSAPAASPAAPAPIPAVLAAILEIFMDASQTAADLSNRLKTAAAALPEAVNAAMAKASQSAADQRMADLTAINEGIDAIEQQLANIRALSEPAPQP